MFSEAGAKASEKAALKHVMRIVRQASDSGERAVTQTRLREVCKSPASDQAGGRVVMSMKYFGRGGDVTPLPQAYFGRGGNVTPLPQAYFGRGACGGGSQLSGVPTAADIKAAGVAEGITLTVHGAREANRLAGTYVAGTVVPLIRHDNPGAKKWTATHVKKAVA